MRDRWYTKREEDCSTGRRGLGPPPPKTPAPPPPPPPVAPPPASHYLGPPHVHKGTNYAAQADAHFAEYADVLSKAMTNVLSGIPIVESPQVAEDVLYLVGNQYVVGDFQRTAVVNPQTVAKLLRRPPNGRERFIGWVIRLLRRVLRVR